jgi:hypothetical protein
VLLAAFVAAAWLGVTATSNASAAPSTATLVDLKDVGVRITVPKGWVALNLAGETASQYLRSPGRHSAAQIAIAKYLKGQSVNVVMYACKTRHDTCFDNVVITAVPAIQGSPVGYESQLKAGYEANGGRDVVVTDTAIDGQPAVQVVAVASAPARAMKTVHETGYVIPAKAGAVEIDFTTDNEGKQNSDVRSMVSSIQLGS